MGMKFYIGSALQNYETVRRVAKVLEAAGHTWTYDWTDRAENELSHDVTESKEFSVGGMGEIGKLEREGVMTADIMVLILPGIRGAHTELGIALGKHSYLGINRIIICAESEEHFVDDEYRTCPFYYLTCVERVVGPIDVWLKEILSVANSEWRY